MTFISDSVKASGQLGTGLGAGIIILGTIALIAPFLTGIATMAMFAVLILAAGITTLAYVFNARSFGAGALQFFVGALITLLGGYMLVHPAQGLEALTSIVIAYFIVDGAFTSIASVQLRPVAGWKWVLASGVSSFVLGLLLWQQWPLSGVYAIGMLIGVRLIFKGWSYVMLGAITNQVSNELKQEVGI